MIEIFDASGSSRDNTCRILFRWRGRILRFLRIKFSDGPAGDGSLYIILDRGARVRWNPETDPVPDALTFAEAPNILPRIMLSYHATGRIHLKGMAGEREARRYGEPIFAISTVVPLFLESIPNPQALDSFEEVPSPTDFMITLPDDASERVSVLVLLTPDQDDAVPRGGAAIRYAGWFRIAFDATHPHPDLQPGAEKALITVVPKDGFLSNQIIDRHAALNFFHKKQTGVQAQILYWNPNTSEFRLIFSVPMRAPPQLHIDLGEPSLRAEIRKITESEARIAVFGPGGRLTSPPANFSITADARL